jgi:ribosome biogenesis GTPase A
MPLPIIYYLYFIQFIVIISMWFPKTLFADALVRNQHMLRRTSLMVTNRRPPSINPIVMSTKLYTTKKSMSDEWVKVDLATPDERRRLDMDDRMDHARHIASSESRMQLSDEDAAKFNRMLGLDEDDGDDFIGEIGSGLDEDLILKPQLRRPPPSGTRSRSATNLIDHKKKLALEKKAAAEKADLPTKTIKGFLDMNPFVCSGCGSAFQSKNSEVPGFLPTDKFKEHRQHAEFIKVKQEAVKLLEMAGVELDCPAAEEMLTAAGMSAEIIKSVQVLGQRSREEEAKERLAAPHNRTETAFVDPEEHGICICQRCFRLQQYGQVEHSLRPGWSSNELLTPERFESLLSSIKQTESVVLCIVDIFDLQGSVVRNLRQIAGNNPVVIAVNKLDLLPKDLSQIRVTNWVYSEIRQICGFLAPIEDGKKTKSSEAGILRMANVHLMSCATDFGVRDIVNKIVGLASQHGSKVHVMGAANVGKSSFINKLLAPSEKKSKEKSYFDKKRAPLVTVSNLPGTTLDFLKIKLPNGITMIDTPGLINKGHLTSKLTTAELKQVIPSKPINPITLRLSEGRCVLMGGLAKIDLLEVCQQNFHPCCCI